MSKERDLLEAIDRVAECLPAHLVDALQELLAQPEQFKPDWASYRQGLEDGIEKTETKQAPVAWTYDWDNTPVICELNGYRWLLGPEAEEELTWDAAVAWCKLNGGELPPREILFLASLNQDAADWFREQPYWSSTELGAPNSWTQSFFNGHQYFYSKNFCCYVRAVRRVFI
jgi:hypothetical protein